MMARIPDGEFALFEVKGNDLLFGRFQMDAGKAFQSYAWNLNTARIVMQIKLGDFIARDASRIRNIYSDNYVVCAARRRRRYGKLVKSESGIAQAEAERKEWLARTVHILAGL